MFVVDHGVDPATGKRHLVKCRGFRTRTIPFTERRRRQRQRDGYAAGPTVRATGSDLDIEGCVA